MLTEVRYDPWQAIGLAQRLVRAGVNMVEFPQTLPNLSMMAGALLDLLRTGTLLLYPSDELRQAAAKTVMIESARGMRLGKAKQSDRVDPIIALAMAALAAAQAGTGAGRMDHDFQARAAGALHDLSAAREQRTRSEGPTRLGSVHVPTGAARLFARGDDVAAAEDRAVLNAMGARGRRWRTW